MQNFFCVIAIATLIAVNSPALASDPNTPMPQGPWFCTASGYDHNNQAQSVSGFRQETENDAKISAVQICRASGLSGCRSESCFKTEL
jgi:hypothetical protein